MSRSAEEDFREMEEYLQQAELEIGRVLDPTPIEEMSTSDHPLTLPVESVSSPGQVRTTPFDTMTTSKRTTVMDSDPPDIEDPFEKDLDEILGSCDSEVLYSSDDSETLLDAKSKTENVLGVNTHTTEALVEKHGNSKKKNVHSSMEIRSNGRSNPDKRPEVNEDIIHVTASPANNQEISPKKQANNHAVGDLRFDCQQKPIASELDSKVPKHLTHKDVKCSPLGSCLPVKTDGTEWLTVSNDYQSPVVVSGISTQEGDTCSGHLHGVPDHLMGENGCITQPVEAVISSSSRVPGSESRQSENHVDNDYQGNASRGGPMENIGHEKDSCTVSKRIETESESNEGHLDLTGFLEGISDTIDELIGKKERMELERKTKEQQNQNKTETCQDLGSNKAVIDDVVDGGDVTNKGNDTSMDEKNGNAGVKNNMLSDSGVDFKGEDVVETDAGYYWLTSTIDEPSKDRDQDAQVAMETDSVSKSGNSADESETCESGIFVEEDLKIELSPIKNGRKNNEKCRSDTPSGDFITDKIADSKVRVNPLMSISTPNFLSLDILGKRIVKGTREGQSKSSESLKNDLRRKQSAQPSFGKVYKVVSVDIPKMDYKMFRKGSVKYDRDSGSIKSSQSLDVEFEGGSRKTTGIVSEIQDIGKENVDRLESNGSLDKIDPEFRRSSSRGLGIKLYTQRKLSMEELCSRKLNRYSSGELVRRKSEQINADLNHRFSDKLCYSTTENKKNNDFAYLREKRNSDNLTHVEMKRNSFKKIADKGKDSGNEVKLEEKSAEKRKSGVKASVDRNKENNFPCLEPPAMFKDTTNRMVQDVTETMTGPILAPPPAFASTPVPSEMESQTAMPMVWDPGVRVAPPVVGLGGTTVERKHKHPITPPPPSVDRTESIISSIMNQHKHRKFSADVNSGLEIVKPPEIPRRKSADSGFQSEYSDINTLHRIQRNKVNDIDRSGHSTVQMPYVDSKVHGDIKTVVRNSTNNRGAANEHVGKPEDWKSKDFETEKGDNMLDVIDSYHKVDGENPYAEVDDISDVPPVDIKPHRQNGVKKVSSKHDTNGRQVEKRVIDSNETFEHLYATVNKHKDKVASDSEENIYATVNKTGRDPNRQVSISPEPSIPDIPPPIPPKPKYLSLSGGWSKKRSTPTVHNDPCPEYQVMFNSLSPVLLRRKPSKKGSRRNGGYSTETSPDTTPEASPRVEKPTLDQVLKNQLPQDTGKTHASSSLFLDPEMARTWHGNTSTNWSQVYGPQLRAMMKELNNLTNEGNQSSDNSLTTSEGEFTEYQSKTLPSKSLLDEMHKKVCADQYWNSRDTEVSRALVLLRLKSAPPVKPKRSQSFNIRMGTGASSSSASSDSSPKLPRVSERIRIKTRPDVQYSPKLGRMRPRARTPDPVLTCSQSQNSRKEDAEIEATEACRWLRETGFPQYAQLYEDGQFPVDIESVEKDHDFLDKEDIQSLFRRLNTLNKCAIMKIGTPAKKETEDSDEEDQCALSDKWKYQRSSRRWSRKDLDSPMIENKNGVAVLKSASSHDSLLADQNSSSETGDSPVLDSKMYHLQDNVVISPHDTNGNTKGLSPHVIRRAASEKIKGAKSFLKRMESLKGKRRKPKTIAEISDPVVTNSADMQAKIKHLNCKDITHSSTNKTDEALINNKNEEKMEVNGSDTESANSSQVTSTESEVERVAVAEGSTDQRVPSSTSHDITLNDDSVFSNTTNGALGLDLSSLSQQSNSSDNTNTSEETLFVPVEYRPGRFPKLLDESLFSNSDSNLRTRSYSVADEPSSELDNKKSRRGSHDPRRKAHRVSIYDNVPIEEDLTEAQQELDIILSELFQNINGLNRAINGDDAELLEPPSSFHDDTNLSLDSPTPENEPNTDARSDITPDENEVISGTLSSPDISDHELQTEDMSHDDSAEHIVCRERRDSGVGSSLTRTNSDRRKYRIRWHSFQKSHRPTSENRNLQLCNLSAGQIMVLKKLSLLKLTALLEKYSPSRSGWSLSMPRLLFKRHKVPDYKGKNVFGVPFSVMIQRTGQALPQCILHAMRFLRRTAGDALGIFRKSGVRSRIQKLRNEIEANPEAVNFDELQAYDVADLVKQYFRELPECLLTTKLSDIFTSIFIYVPVELRLEALQAAVVLMVDENRDVLQSLLLFLSDIAKQHHKHQMTASNLAVCFAPSLFNMGGGRNPSQTPSPRRNRKNPGIPDARELMEQKAAHECLTVMIQESKKLFTIPAATLSKCRVWHGDPVTLDQLNSGANEGNKGYTAYIDSCIQGLLKESREKFRGWVTEKIAMDSDIDVANKKVGDGHPLRLWKCTVDVEAPPTEVLNRVLNDRQMWDEDLLQWNTVEKLDKQTEVFQFVRNTMAPHPTRDFCVLRSWRTDLPRGACVLISTSIEHPRAELHGGIQAVELASRYLIEPCGTGKSRLTHISRVDIRGHSPDWYKKVYGHLCANFMDKIRASFRCNSDGPETKV